MDKTIEFLNQINDRTEEGTNDQVKRYELVEQFLRSFSDIYRTAEEDFNQRVRYATNGDKMMTDDIDVPALVLRTIVADAAWRLGYLAGLKDARSGDRCKTVNL